MTKKVLLTALVCCIVNVVSAQLSIQGKVIDENGNPIVGANLRFEDTTIGTVSAVDGKFAFQNIPNGKYVLLTTSLNYDDEKTIVDKSKNDLLITLKDSPLKLNEVVVTGTGTLRHLKNSPVAIDVISKKELNNISASSFEDAMMAISPSFSISPNAMGSHLRLNGLGNRYIQILINGKRLAGDVSGNIDLSRINISNIKRVEVLKGASSSLYGSDAMGGVINIITENPKEALYITSNSRYARYGQFVQSINADVNTKRFSSATSFLRNQSNGWQLSNKEIKGNDLIDTDKKAVNSNYSDILSQNLTYRPNQSLSFYTEGSLYDKKIKRSPKSYTYDMKYEDYTISAGSKYVLENMSLITLDFYTDNFEYYREYIRKSGNYEVGEKTKERRQKYYDINLKGVFDIGSLNKLSVGSQYQINYIEGNSDVKNGSREVYTYSIYVQDEIQLIDRRLQIVPGLRYIYNEAFGNRFTPKLSGMYSLKHFNFRAFYSAGFRTPDLKELYAENISGTTLSLGNANLKPESSNYYSLNTEYYNDFLAISVSGYINRIKNIIQTRDISETITPQETTDGIKKKREYINSSKARANGLEVSVNSNLVYGLSIGLGYSFVDTKDYDTGNPLVRSSKHIGTGNVNWKKKWWIVDSNINFNGRIQSKRYFGDGDDARSYNQWNIATNHRFKSFNGLILEPGFGVENIFNFVDDKPFGHNYSTLSPGRTFYINLSIKFIK